MSINLVAIGNAFMAAKLGLGLNLAIYQNAKWEEISVGYLGNKKIQTNSKIYYDIASLTKTFVATIFLEAQTLEILSLDNSASQYIKCLQNFPQIKIKNLLNHTSYLELIKKYDKNKFYNPKEITQILFTKENLQINKQSNYQYSDLNYLILGKILEQIYRTNLDQIFENFKTKYNLQEVFYRPLEKGVLKSQIAPSESLVKVGTPQDEKARWLGGIAGHAGMFASLEGLKSFLELWLNNSFGLSKDLYDQALGKDLHLTNFSQNTAYGLVFRRGYLSYFANHAGFAGPFFIFDKSKTKLLAGTCNYHYPHRSIAKKQIFVRWVQNINLI